MTATERDGRPETLTLLAQTWLTGFGVSRRAPVRRVGPVTEVEVGVEGRRLELVLVEPDEAVLSAVLARVVGTTDVWSTILTCDPWRPELPSGVHERLVGEALMVSSSISVAPEAPHGGRVEVEPDGDRAFVQVVIGGEVAAQGQVAVVGEHAVFDRIGTESEFRRRGLATTVMRSLGAWATRQGASHGVLAASVEGQTLYGRLGWWSVGAMLTVAGGPDGA